MKQGPKVGRKPAKMYALYNLKELLYVVRCILALIMLYKNMIHRMFEVLTILSGD